VSLSKDPAFSLLKSDFVCGWRNIANEPYCGISSNHDTTNPAAITTNGAGPHNIQLFILAPDGTVLHCLPGYWDPTDLAYELKFAKELANVWSDTSLSRAQKDEKFRSMQLASIAQHPREMVRRSEMQGFDKKYEARKQTSDCIVAADTPAGEARIGARKQAKMERMKEKGADSKLATARFKTTNVIVHERMAERPFVPYADFDVAEFSDYGRPKYDKKRIDEGTGVLASTASRGAARRMK
jgi:hypothetical protein